MKKIVIFLIVVIFPFLIQAEELEVSDINLKINLSDDFIAFTRDNLDENQDLLDMGLTKDYMEETMNNNSIYLDIIKNDISYEILVVVLDRVIPFDSLSNADEETLTNLEDELVKMTNAKVYSVYEGNNNYVMLDYYDSNTNYYIINYYTVVNYRGYNIQMQKKSVITNEEKEEFKNIVDSVEIKNIYENKKGNTIEKKVGKTGLKFDVNNIVLGAIIGAFAGLVSYLISLIIKKKKSSK